MANNIRKSVEISADASGVTREMQGLGGAIERALQGANDSFERLQTTSEGFANSVKLRMEAMENSMSGVLDKLIQNSREHSSKSSDRLKFIQQEVNSTRQQIQLDTERLRIAEKMRYEQEVADMRDSGADKTILKAGAEDHRELLRGIEAERKTKEHHLNLISRQASDTIVGEAAGEDRNQLRGSYFGAKAQEAQRGALSGAGLAGLVSIGGLIAKAVSEGVQLDESRSRRRGLGITAGGSGAAFGLKDSDFFSYQADVAQQAGSGGYSAMRNLAFEKRFSQEIGALGGLTSGLRTERSGRNAGDVALEMLGFFKSSGLFDIEKGDFTQLSEKLQFSTEMLQMQSQQMFTTNATTNAQILSALGSAGIDDQRTMGFVGAMNNAITSPSNDFVRAFTMRSLRQSNPEAGLLDLLKIQEQGIYGQGTLGGLVGDAKKAFTGDALVMNLASMFGLKYHQAEQLLGLDQDMLDSIGTKTELEQTVAMSEGRGGAGVMSRRMAQINNALGRGGEKAITTVDSYITAFEQGGVEGMMAKMSGDITGIMEAGFSRAADVIGEKLDGFVNGAKESMSDFFGVKSSRAKYKKQTAGVQDYDYTSVDPTIFNEPPQLEMYGFKPFGGDGFSMEGNERSGSFSGKKVSVGLNRDEASNLSAAQLLDIFAFAMEKGYKEVSRQQVEELLRNGIDKTNHFLEQMNISASQLQTTNKVYSTENK